MVPKSILSSILVSNSREIHGDKRNGLKPTFFVDPLLNLEADVNGLPDISQMHCPEIHCLSSMSVIEITNYYIL